VNRILVMGQAGSGKTTFAEKLVDELIARGYPVGWLNADDVREEYDDWDFSDEGRMRAAVRMKDLSEELDREFVVIDMISPTKETRAAVEPDFVVFMDTIKEGRFEDTNKLFQAPPCDLVDVCFQNYPDQEEAACVADKVLTWL
jgi:adenylylsulfate kinase